MRCCLARLIVIAADNDENLKQDRDKEGQELLLSRTFNEVTCRVARVGYKHAAETQLVDVPVKVCALSKRSGAVLRRASRNKIQ